MTVINVRNVTTIKFLEQSIKTQLVCVKDNLVMVYTTSYKKELNTTTKTVINKSTIHVSFKYFNLFLSKLTDVGGFSVLFTWKKDHLELCTNVL